MNDDRELDQIPMTGKSVEDDLFALKTFLRIVIFPS
jgi:hypothetical protein